MLIKPGCDVENLEDFARYYEYSFMECRDGRVLQVTGAHGPNLVLLDHQQRSNRTEGYVFMPWSDVQDSLVYGRPSGSLLRAMGKVYMMYIPNNRMAGRGFRGDYYRFTYLRRGNDLRWQAIGLAEFELAREVFFPQVTPLADALKGEGDHILSKMYALVRGHEDPDLMYLARRSEIIGRFLKPDMLELYSSYTWAEPFIRRELKFTGVIQYANS